MLNFILIIKKKSTVKILNGLKVGLSKIFFVTLLSLNYSFTLVFNSSITHYLLEKEALAVIFELLACETVFRVC